MKVIDISRPISSKEAIYPGNSKVVLTPLKDFKKDGSVLSELTFGLHTATHLDAPAHYVARGRSIEKIKLENCLGPARLFDCTQVAGEITLNDFDYQKIKKGEIVLFKTKNSLRKGKRFYPDFSHLGEVAARLLIKKKVKGVGIDGPSIRRFRLRPDTVHPLLLKANLSVYEGLDLKKAKAGTYFFIGMPLKIKGGEASPVRAVLLEE